MKSLIEIFLKELVELNWKYWSHFQVQRLGKPSVSLKEANRKDIIVMEKVTQGGSNTLVELNYVKDRKVFKRMNHHILNSLSI